MKYQQNIFEFDLRSKVIARKALRGYTLQEVAEEIGISRTKLHRIMNGATPSVETFAIICGWLNRKPHNYIK